MMFALKAIYKKELKSFFYSPLGYVLMSVFFLFMGFVFAAFIASYQQYVMSYNRGMSQAVSLDQLSASLYQSTLWFLSLFVVPLLTMRLYAEETKQQTLELLLTSPVKGYELILGKFFSAMTFFLLILGGSFLYAFFMILWGNPDIQIIVSTYVGLTLTLATYVAIGGFFSAFCTSPVVAGVLALFSSGFLWLFAALGSQVGAKIGNQNVGDILTYISPLTHFNGFSDGNIQLRDVVYLLSFTLLFLFLTHRVVESHRWR